MPTIEISHVDYYKDPDDNYQSTLFTSEGYGGGTDYSYIVLRSVNMANPDGLYSEYFQHDYRLMCFEMQDYYTVDVTFGEANGPIGDNFKIKTVFQDASMEIVDSIIAVYKNMMDGELAEYLTEAEEKCAYNNIEDYFNTYFAAEMSSRYSDLSIAPWNAAPIIYNMHRDLLYDEFRGDKEEILLNAQRLVAQISPDTGTLDGLQQFVQQFQKLYDDYYGRAGLVFKAIADAGTWPEDLPAYGGTSVIPSATLKYWQDYGADKANSLPDVTVSEEVMPYYDEGNYGWQDIFAGTHLPSAPEVIDFGRYWQNRDAHNLENALYYMLSDVTLGSHRSTTTLIKDNIPNISFSLDLWAGGVDQGFSGSGEHERTFYWNALACAVTGAPVSECRLKHEGYWNYDPITATDPPLGSLQIRVRLDEGTGLLTILDIKQWRLLSA